jgi:hypothetical protein
VALAGPIIRIDVVRDTKKIGDVNVEQLLKLDVKDKL